MNKLTPIQLSDFQKFEFGIIIQNGNFYGCYYMGHDNLICDLAEEGLIEENRSYRCGSANDEWSGCVKLWGVGFASGDTFPYTFYFRSSCEYERIARWEVYEKDGKHKDLRSIHIRTNGERNDPNAIQEIRIDEMVEEKRFVSKAQIETMILFCKAQGWTFVPFNYGFYDIEKFASCFNEEGEFDIFIGDRIEKSRVKWDYQTRSVIEG